MFYIFDCCNRVFILRLYLKPVKWQVMFLKVFALIMLDLVLYWEKISKITHNVLHCDTSGQEEV